MAEVTNYPSNSNEKPREPKVKPVTKAVVMDKKEKPFLAKFLGENMRDVAEYVLWDVLIPAGKSAINDMVTNGIEMLLFGEPSQRKRTGIHRDKGRSYVSYNSMYAKPKPKRTTRRGTRWSFDEVVIPDKHDAEDVLSTLVELVDQYDVASVSDFFSSVGLTSQHTDQNWGWDDLSTAYVRRVAAGYILILPQPELIE